MTNSEIKKIAVIGDPKKYNAFANWLKLKCHGMEIIRVPLVCLDEEFDQDIQVAFLYEDPIGQESSDIPWNLVSLIERLPEGAEIFVRSTTLPGTADALGRRTGRDVVAAPSFATYRKAEWDANYLPFVTGYSETAVNLFPTRGVEVIQMSNTSAELAKCSHNALSAIKTTFFNQVKEVCENKGLDYSLVIEGICSSGMFTRWGTLVPGPDGLYGFGGQGLSRTLNGFLPWLVDVPKDMLTGCIADNHKFRRKPKPHLRNRERNAVTF